MNPDRGQRRGSHNINRIEANTEGHITLDDALENYRSAIVRAVSDTGIQQSEATDAEFVDDALTWIWRLPADFEFSVDDVRSALGGSHAMGGVFRRASRAGLISCIGVTTSRFVQRHGSVQRVWRRA